MSSTTLQIRIDSELRREAEALFSGAGLDLSSAVRLFLRQSVIRRRLPFEVIGDTPAFSGANQQTLAESPRSIKRGAGVPHPNPTPPARP